MTRGQGSFTTRPGLEGGVRIGIDLGTTNSLAACLVDGRPIVIPNALGERLTPSAVSIDDDGTVLVGAAARARALTHPDRTACNFKRDMGTDREYTLAGRVFRPEALSALVLADLRDAVQAFFGEPVREAVVTVPAYFGERQRRATQAACELAKLPVERIINEPTAAALAYGLQSGAGIQSLSARAQEGRFAVLDLGGGTFDVSILEITGGVIEIQASAGDSRLGGEDFVEVMMDHVAARLVELHGVEIGGLPQGLAKLRDACERSKRALTSSETASLVLANLELGGRVRTLTLELERKDVHGWWRELVSRMRTPVRQALADARLSPEQVDRVLLVGGATRMPIVDDFVAQVFNRAGLRTLPPDEAIAMGAAVQVALKASDEQVGDLVVTDVAPFTLGIDSASMMGVRYISGLFSPILERGTVLPASRVQRFHTVADRQREISVGIYQGEHSLCQHNTKIGEYRITGIPPAPAGEQSIDVRFTYDLNGLLEVETTVVETGVRHVHVIDRAGLDANTVERTQAEFQRLKFHPREALPNVTALERADALYTTLTGHERELLGHALHAFRLCLEGQDPAEIARVREELVAITRALQRD